MFTSQVVNSNHILRLTVCLGSTSWADLFFMYEMAVVGIKYVVSQIQITTENFINNFSNTSTVTIVTFKRPLCPFSNLSMINYLNRKPV